MSLLVVGTSAFDSVSTPAGEKNDILGGSATFFSTTSSFFTQTRMVSVIGEDFPQEHLDFFKSRAIDTDGVQTLAGKTFRWRAKYSDDLNVAHTLETQLNVLEKFDATLPAHYCDSQFVMLGNIEPTLQLKVVKQLTNPRLIACDTMNFWIDSTPEALLQTLKHIDLLCINDAEAKQLAQKNDLVGAVRDIQKQGPKTVVIKRGEYGVCLFHEDAMFAIPAMLLERVVDPTGAGDSFAGGMMGYLSTCSGQITEQHLRSALVVGTVMASFAVEDFSIDRLRTLTHADIQARLQQFAKLTHFSVNDIHLPSIQALNVA